MPGKLKNKPGNNKYKVSEWVKLYARGDEVCFFHPIHLKILVGDSESRELFLKYKKPRTIEQSLSPGKNIINMFIRHGFLIPESSSDDETFVRRRKELLKKYSDVNITQKRFKGLRIILTEKCNMKCTYCYVRRDVAEYKDMGRSTLFKALDLLIDMNKNDKISIQFSGGEPLRRFESVKESVYYLEEAKNRGAIESVSYALETNATLISDEIAEFMAAHRFVVAVSLDGPGEINDRCRIFKNNRGSFNRAIKGLQLLQKYNNNIHIDLTPTRINVSCIGSCFEYFIRELKCKSMTINTPQPGPQGWEICGKTLAREVVKCLKIAKKYNGYVESLGDRVYVGLDNEEPQLLSCSTFTNTLTGAVSPDGKISYCIVSWNIDESTQPIENFSINSAFRMWKYNELYIKDSCLRCPAVNVCGGPCSLESYYENQTSIKDRERCRFYNTLLKEAVWL